MKKDASKSRYLVDSDFLIAVFKKDDSSHTQASFMSRKLNDLGCRFYCLNLVVQESTTVISKTMGMEAASSFYTGLNNFINMFILVDERLEKLGWEVFLSQDKRGTSFVDCTNLAAVTEYKLDGLLSFDKFYPKEILVAQKYKTWIK